MDTRREFLKKAALLSGSAGLATLLPQSIQRAMAINPSPNSTFWDAEHVVIMMQENRSFDHCFGTLQGVRGFNDPRAITIPGGNPVWLQSNAAGETYAPFRLNIKDTKATWMGSLPHVRSSQVDAFNNGKFNKWLEAKHSAAPKYRDMPLTLGHYNREDIPFNYALADAFTVCDQNFCSGMTSTHPNRSFFWTGTIREEQNGKSRPYIRNTESDYCKMKWKAFPETLEENNISWKVYQNDLDCGGGFGEEERAWLANYGCNPLEFFANFNVKFADRYVNSLKVQRQKLPTDINTLEDKLNRLSAGSKEYDRIKRQVDKKREVLADVEREIVKWSPENFNKLSQKDKNLFNKAFSKNDADPYYRELTTLKYKDDGKNRELKVPKGDVFHTFRSDVDSGKLPAVSWIVPSQNFSDHPSAPWYGAYFVSEVIDILTKNPEVWKKTIFILTYDENDGYFDHIPPFIPPDLSKPDTGKCSAGIPTEVEYIYRADEIAGGISKGEARDGAVGLGYRVPMIIASPWSRGGQVCSQVFDHTSTLQFLETLFSKKSGRDIKHHNISQWRRTICGNLTSAFAPYKDANDKLPFLKEQPFIEGIYNAKFLREPVNFKKLSADDITFVKTQPEKADFLPRQEKGVRIACALPYALYADGKLSANKQRFEIAMGAAKNSVGVPFKIYAPGNFSGKGDKAAEAGKNWNYAVATGDQLTDNWNVDDFENNSYHLRLYGPNGFYREFMGDSNDPLLAVTLDPSLSLKLVNKSGQKYNAQIIHHGYQHANTGVEVRGDTPTSVFIPFKESFGWYDFTVKVTGFKNFEIRYAGHMENGESSFTDPVMGHA